MLEAWIRGCRPISYGWGVAHIRLNNQAFQRFGIAEVAPDRAALRGALERALATPRRPHPEYGEQPTKDGAVSLTVAHSWILNNIASSKLLGLFETKEEPLTHFAGQRYHSLLPDSRTER